MHSNFVMFLISLLCPLVLGRDLLLGLLIFDYSSYVNSLPFVRFADFIIVQYLTIAFSSLVDYTLLRDFVFNGGIQMRIGLWNDSSHFPNLCSMKLSAYHRSIGDHTELYDPTHDYDLIYASKVFTQSIEPEFGDTPVIRGGSGYDLVSKLPAHIEHICPDYSLYPNFNAALGILTRGCPRLTHAQSRGGFCITPDKDGCVSRKVADLSDFWIGQKEIYLLDQNLLASSDRYDLLQQLSDSKALVTFDGGMDVRYMNDSVIDMFRRIRVKDFHFAWDDPRENLESYFITVSRSGLVNKDQCGVYVLTNFWSTTDQDLYRIYFLRKHGFVPYVMIYDKQKYVHDNGKWRKGVEALYSSDQLRHFKVCQHLQRWCNNRALIKSVPDFNDYDWYANWVHKGMPVPS